MKAKRADTAPEVARSALRAIFQERDSWERYTDEYDETMLRYTRLLFWASAILLLLGIAAFSFSPYAAVLWWTIMRRRDM